MLRLFRSRLGLSFVFGFSMILLSSMLLLTLVSLKMLRNFASSTISLNKEAIKKQTEHLLVYGVDSQAGNYSAILQQAAVLSSTLAKEAEYLLEHKEKYGEFNINNDEKLSLYPNHLYSNDVSGKLSVIYSGEEYITPQIQRKINTLSHLDPLLINAKNSSPFYSATYVVINDGISRYYPNVHYAPNLPPMDEYDYFRDEYYFIVTPEQNPKRETLWTKPVEDMTGKGLLVTVSSPVYGAGEVFKGVVGIDVDLSALVDDILGNKNTINSKHYRGEFHFLIDKQADVISLPFNRLEMFGLEAVDPKTFTIGQVLQRSFLKSSYSKIREIAHKAIEQDNGFDRLIFKNESYSIAYHKIAATNWILGIIIPDHELLDSIRKTESAMTIIHSSMIYHFLVIASLFLIIIFIGTMYHFNKRLLQPIMVLIDFTKNFTIEKISPVEIKQHGEIKELAISFNKMISELKNTTVSRDKLQDALDNIKTLKGLLPICASCKKIRDDEGYWNQIESYVQENSEAKFSHGMCPECMDQYYPLVKRGRSNGVGPR